MIYRIYPSKDATIYEDSVRKNQNTGKDEILEVGKFYDTDNATLLGNSRALIQFDLTSISSSIVSGDITSPQYRLRMENIESRGISSDYDLYVYPLKESWQEGVGSEVDTPHNETDVSWVYKASGSAWDVVNSTVGKALTPSQLPGLDVYYDFLASAGDLSLTQSIVGSDGTLPSINVVSGALQFSASYFGGGTVNLDAYMKVGTDYNIYFEMHVGSLNGVDFRVYEPNSGGGGSTEDGYIYANNITTNSTHSIRVSPNSTGTHKLQWTYFDTDGSDGVAGKFDNFYVNKIVASGSLIQDEYNIDGPLTSNYTLNEKISGFANESTTASVIGNVLLISSSNFSGATLNRSLSVITGLGYTASFTASVGDYDEISFDVMEPDGKFLVERTSITSSGVNTYYFNSQQTGTHYLRWSVFGSGSGEFTGSIDNLIVTTDADLIPTGSEYTDIYYEAKWVTNQGGGTWYTASFSNGNHYKQSFTKYTDNLNVEVTDYVNEWLDGTRTNNGLIIKKQNTDESSTRKFGSIKFFSSDTNTIYPPTLEVRWDDSSFSTGSLEALDTDDMIVYVKNLGTEYKESSKGKIRVYGRERFPARTFSSTSNYTLVKYLPTTTYYSVVDAETEQVIIPFDTNYTKVSCDSTSNYFNFWFNGLQPERFYKFVFRVDQNGTTRYFDDNFYFKVVR